MFKHEAAPLFKNSNQCKVSKCQFSHTSHDKEKHYAQSDDDIELIEEDDDHEDDLIEEPDCGNCKVINNFVKHTNDEYQHCSACEFKTKCWMEYNTHWQKTPGHTFSSEELKDMGYCIQT